MSNQPKIKPILNGEILKKAMSESAEKREVIAEGFLAKNEFFMFVAEPGAGKSTLSAQALIELTSGLPLFGTYKVPRPMKVLYIQAERSIMELLERVKEMSEHYPINYDNIYATDSFQVLNLMNANDADAFIDYIDEYCPDIDIIFIDPIYATVRGGLKDDIPASSFTNTMSHLQAKLRKKSNGPLLWYNHHTKRDTYSKEGDRIKHKNNAYGSQWLFAHATIIYEVEKGKNGTKFFKTKDNYKFRPNELNLQYDNETGLSTVDVTDMPAIDRINFYLDKCKAEDKTITFNDIQNGSKVCTRTARDIIMHSYVKDRLKVVNTIKTKKFYKIIN